MTMTRVLIFLFIYSFFSCSSKNGSYPNNNASSLGYMVPKLKSSNTDSITNLIVDVQKLLPSLKTSDIIDSIWWVPLETNQYSYLGGIGEFEFYDGKIFILDNVIAEQLVVYDSFGKHLYTLKGQGKGPREFQAPWAFTIDKLRNQILINDDFLRKILYYSLEGKFVKEVTGVPFRFNEFHFLDSTNLAFHTSRRQNDHLDEISGYSLVVGPSTDSLVAKGFPFVPTQGVKMMGNSFVNFGGTLFYHYPLRDTIYEITKEAVIPQIVVNFGKNKLPKDFEIGINTHEFQKKYLDNKESDFAFVNSSRGFFISDHHLFVEGTYKGNRLFIYHFKETGQTLFTNKLEKDLPETLFFGSFCGSYNNTLVNYVSPEEIMQAKEYFDKNPEAKEKISTEILTEIKRLSEKTMPLLVFYTLKNKYTPHNNL